MIVWVVGEQEVDACHWVMNHTVCLLMGTGIVFAPIPARAFGFEPFHAQAGGDVMSFGW